MDLHQVLSGVSGAVLLSQTHTGWQQWLLLRLVARAACPHQGRKLQRWQAADLRLGWELVVCRTLPMWGEGVWDCLADSTVCQSWARCWQDLPGPICPGSSWLGSAGGYLRARCSISSQP